MECFQKTGGRCCHWRPSSTLRVTSLANKLVSEGQDVVSFAAGEPDFDTPDFY